MGHGIRAGTLGVCLAFGLISCGGDAVTPPAFELLLQPSAVQLEAAGDTLRLVAHLREVGGPYHRDAQIAWRSSDNLVASVDADGLVTARGRGRAFVTASAQGQSAEAIISVVQEVEAFAVVPMAPLVAPGASLQLTPNPTDANGVLVRDITVTWASSDTTVAVISPSGVLEGRKKGVTWVTASGEGHEVVLPVSVGDASDWSAVRDWVTWQGGPEHTGHVRATIDPGALSVAWTVQPEPGAQPQPPVTGEGSVFVAANGYGVNKFVYALDVTSGAVRWSQWVRDAGDLNGPAFGDGAVFVSTSGGLNSSLIALEAATGVQRFRVPYQNTSTTYLAPIVVDGGVFIGGFGGNGAYRFNARDGSVEWVRQNGVGSEIGGWSASFRDGLLYFATASLTVLDARTGATVRFTHPPPYSTRRNPQSVALGPADDAYTTHNGRLIRWNARQGGITWYIEADVHRQVTIAGDTLYLAGAFARSSLEARGRHDGSLLWSWSPPTRAPVLDFPMIVTDNLVFVSTDNDTYAVHLGTHEPVWSWPRGGALALSKDGWLIIASKDGTLTGVTLR